jgi:hypothetical protein
MEMNYFLITFLVFLFGVGAYLFVGLRDAPFIDDYDEPYEGNKKKENQEELDPTELFQATKNVKVDTSNWKQDETQYEQEEGLFDEGKSKHNE